MNTTLPTLPTLPGLNVCLIYICWVVGLLGCWVVGLLGCWVVGLLGCWVVGLLGCWVAGLLGCWVAGLLGCWDVGLHSLTPAKRYSCSIAENKSTQFRFTIKKAITRAEQLAENHSGKLAIIVSAYVDTQ